MENHKVAVARVRPGMSALLLVVFAMVLAGFCNPAWAGVSATITQGWPEASPDTVPAGGDSTLYYSVTITGLRSKRKRLVTGCKPKLHLYLRPANGDQWDSWPCGGHARPGFGVHIYS